MAKYSSMLYRYMYTYTIIVNILLQKKKIQIILTYHTCISKERLVYICKSIQKNTVAGSKRQNSNINYYTTKFSTHVVQFQGNFVMYTEFLENCRIYGTCIRFSDKKKKNIWSDRTLQYISFFWSDKKLAECPKCKGEISRRIQVYQGQNIYIVFSPATKFLNKSNANVAKIRPPGKI